jgi:hypothetical protein
MAFREPSDVVVKQLDDENWELRQPLTYAGKTEIWKVPETMRTDFASVPRLFVWLLPRYGRYTKAAIVHDYLWRERARNGVMDWRDADATFRRALRELEVAFLRRWVMWAAVRWGSFLKPGGLQGWWRDAWAVLLVSIVAVPIVAPPAILVLLGLIAFYAVEMLLWVPLKLVAVAKAKFGKGPPRKQVNTPSLLLKL